MRRSWPTFRVLLRFALAAVASIMLATACDSSANRADLIPPREPSDMPQSSRRSVKLFLCGDVMTGRGIDQVMATPSAPQLFESYVKSATGYVRLAEEKNGPIDKPVPAHYIWGDALDEFIHQQPDVKIINLETSVTAHDQPWPGKGIHYRMHPQNVGCLVAAGIDVCSLANNHVLDWGRAGLTETLATLQNAGIETAGAGANTSAAAAPAIIEIGDASRVLIFAFGLGSAGVYNDWAATDDRPGVNFLEDLSRLAVQRIARQVAHVQRPGDVVVASIHWGGNWGYDVSQQQRQFAYQLIEDAGVDVIFGHSSHHPMGIEVHDERPILYGCGDFINDYEGIGGHEEYRGDLSLMYFLTIDSTSGSLIRLEMTPTRIQRFCVQRAGTDDTRWLHATVKRECGRLGTDVDLTDTGKFVLKWAGD